MICQFLNIKFVGSTLLILGGISLSVSVSADSSGDTENGRNSRYHEQFDEASDDFRQDISGAAVSDRGVIILADDGGKPSDFSFIRVLRNGLPDAEVDENGHIIGEDPSVNIPLELEHDDMEGATFVDGFFVVTSSLSASGGASVDARNRLTRFKVSRHNVLYREQTRSDLRAPLIDALKNEIGGRFDESYNFNAGGTSGGLNIEGITFLSDDDDNRCDRRWYRRHRGHHGDRHSGNDTLLWGLRAPLAHADPNDPTNQKLGHGAIIAKIDDPWGAASISVYDILDLGDGQGIRGIEWIEELEAYVIIAGTLIKASDYHLWYWSPEDDLLFEITHAVDGFGGLCRPEAVIQVDDDDDELLAVLSEESGTACEFVEYNYVLRGLGH